MNTTHIPPMVDTADLAKALEAAREQLDSITDYAKRLRAYITATEAHLSAAEALLAPAGTTKRRKRGPKSTPGAPPELLELTTSQRIEHVMMAKPDKRWTVPMLLDATHVATKTSLQNELRRMKERSEVARASDGTWTLLTTPSQSNELH